MTDEYRIARIRHAQKVRMAHESWDYLNTSSPNYPEIIVHQGEVNGLGIPLSVGEAKSKYLNDNSLNRLLEGLR